MSNIAHHRATGIDVEHKEDESPVTQSDNAADAMICEGLRALTPDIGIVSEEGSHDTSLAAQGRFWCVDPLDGTKNFIRGKDEFTVNIALIKHHQPVFGVIYVPAQYQLYYGIATHDYTRAVADFGQGPVA
ncbi:MAG: inositol monophosphatase family protein, partial [Pseudomonadota bacterium]